MKVIITQTDLESLVRQKLGRPIGNELTVEFTAPELTVKGENYVESIHRVQYLCPNYNSNQKIEAIKKLRELVPGLGLADAKQAVENPQEAIQHWIRHGNFYKYR